MTKGIFTIKRRKRGGTGIQGGLTKKRVYLIFQVTPNFASIFYSKKERKAKNGTGLPTCKPMDDKEWIPPLSHSRYIGWSRKEKSVYEARSKMGIQ